MRNGCYFLWNGPVQRPDQPFYVSIIEQGATGHLRMVNLYSTESQHPVFMHGSYLLLGLCSMIFHISPLIMYHIGHVVLGAVLLAVCWFALSVLLKDDIAKKMAFTLICFSAGIGWLTSHRLGEASSVDLWMNEAVTYSTLAAPHYALATALKFGALICFFLAVKRDRKRYAAIAGLCSGALVFEHPYQLVSIAVIAAIYGLLSVAACRDGDRIELGRRVITNGLLVVAIALPFVIAGWREASTSELIRLRSQSSDGPVPPFPSIIEGYGLLWILAFAGVWSEAREGRILDRDALLFLVVLSLAGTFLMMPLGAVWFSRRLILGAHIPIAILAGVGLAGLYARAVSSRVPSLVAKMIAGAVILFCSTTNLASFYEALVSLSYPLSETEASRYTLTKPEDDAIHWIRANTARSAVVQALPCLHLNKDDHTYFGDETLLEWEPALTGRKTYVAHYLETYQYAKKFAAITNLDLRGAPIDYLVYTDGPLELRAYAPLQRAVPPSGLVKVYVNHNITIFRVVPSADRV
ncbi:MAG: hypothetical protein P4L33_05575 [Capsulimonadaceae bacterium]|nr:hypothetical protein [Capsulimonadaceae bacterium]